MMAIVWFVLTAAALIMIGVALGVLTAFVQSGTISRIEEAMGRGDYDQEQERGRRQA